jgi:hypothetical protein
MELKDRPQSSSASYPVKIGTRTTFNNLQSLWLFSARTFTIFVLIVLPSICIITTIFFPSIIQISQYYFQNGRIIASIIFYFQLSVFFIMLLAYPPHPAPIPTKNYFESRGYENAVFEYGYIIKILYVALPLLGFLAIVNSSILESLFPLKSYLIEPLQKTYGEKLIGSIVGLLQILLLFIVVAALLKIVFSVVRREFRLFFAKGCFRIIKNEQKKNEVSQMKYFIMGLNSYNRYLRRHMKLQIANLKKIYSIVASSPIERKKEYMDGVAGAFESESELEPVRYLYSFSNTIRNELLHEPVPDKIKEDKIKDWENEGFLVEEPISGKIKEWGRFASVMVPVAITIVELYLRSLRIL